MRFFVYLLFSAFFLLTSRVFAQDPDQISSDPGVLVSSPTHRQVSDQGSIGNNENGETSVQNPTKDHSHSDDTSNSSMDPIVLKATDAVMFQITKNMKLTQDQMNAIRPIITDNIVKIRDLQQSLEKGVIDGKTMYSQREQLTKEEGQELSHIFTPDQMKVWVNIQSQ